MNKVKIQAIITSKYKSYLDVILHRSTPPEDAKMTRPPSKRPCAGAAQHDANAFLWSHYDLAPVPERLAK